MATYELPDLRYDYHALEPHISARQLELHHSKHHATYVKQANELLEKMAGAEAAQLPALTKALAFNVSGHVLHSLFWDSLTPGGSRPTGALAEAIDATFGSRNALVEQLSGVITTLQGSGWAALVWEPVAQRLVVTQLRDHQDNSIAGATAVLVIDGWEHAYYLDHQNDRGAWTKAVGHLLDWEHASQRFDLVRDMHASAAR
jgi:Fe-Mn family superoxide dismutase